ncbi:MAG TPA: hypothetical protein VNI78_02280, partial [Vicinamibacterales bacterium]|nr:hypothetical protein [Vicinamibacterales bacterium]
MARLLQPAFTSGEISPSLYARVDLALYQTGLRKLRNCFVRPHGGVSNRSGTQFVSPARNNEQTNVLIPFVFSTEQAYILEFSAGAIQVFANGGFVAGTLTYTLTSVVVSPIGPSHIRTITTSTPHGRTVGETITIAGVIATGAYAVNGTWTVLTTPTATTLTIKSWSGAVTGSYVSGGTLTFNTSVPNPYSEDELIELRYAQSADVLTVVHKNHPPYEFRRLSASSFTFTQATYNTGPFLDANTDKSIKVHASAAYGTVTLTATRDLFTSSHVGALLYLESQDLSKVLPWEAGGHIANEGESTLGVLRRSEGKIYRCVTNETADAGTAIRSGSVRPTHESGVQKDGQGKALLPEIEIEGVDWEYLHSGFGIVRITAVASGTSATATVLRRLPDEVVGGATMAQGPWTMTGDGIDTTLAITGATSHNRHDFEVTFDGVIQDASLYEVNATTDVLTFFTAPAVGVAVSARQLSANNRTDVWALGAWGEHQGYPSLVTYFQDRLIFAASRERPQTLWGSKTGNYIDFGVSVPSVDDDALNFTMNARQINVIRDLVPLDKLIVLTSAGAWKVTDGQDEVLTPTTVGFKPQSYRGAKAIRSVVIGDEALFVHEGGRKIRTLGYRYESDKFTGVNLSIKANHLLKKNKTVVDMDYADEPHAILNMVRSDGELLQLTYDAEQEVIGWAHSDTRRGWFERVCSIPEDGDNAVYLTVRRTINGQTVRYIERLADREIDDVRDGVFLDSALSFDGRGDGVVTLTLTGASWTQGSTITCTASASTFSSARPPDEVVLEMIEEEEDEDGDTITTTYRVRCEFVSYTSATVITVRALSDVPSELQGVATTIWSQAFDTFTGLDHLEGEQVSVCADGSEDGPYTVSNGTVTLTHPASVVHIGLPIVADIEALDINVAGAETVRDLTKHIGSVSVLTQETRDLLIGPDVDHLDEVPVREAEDYDQPADYLDDVVTQYIATTWSKGGR